MDPFKRLDSPALSDMLTDGAVDVLAERGLDRFSIGAVARRMDMSPQAVSNRFPSSEGGRPRVLQLITVTFGKRWLAWVTPGLAAEPPMIRLPENDAERHGVRVWLALAELARGERARGNTGLESAVGWVRSREREDLAVSLEQWTGSRIPPDEVMSIVVLVEGLRAELASGDPHLNVETGHELLRSAMERLRQSRAAAGR